jgi:hypothetical protein
MKMSSYELTLYLLRNAQARERLEKQRGETIRSLAEVDETADDQPGLLTNQTFSSRRRRLRQPSGVRTSS